jgi:hypothetical protein
MGDHDWIRQELRILCDKVDRLRISIDGDNDHTGLRERIGRIEARLDQIQAQADRQRSGIWDIVTASAGAIAGAVCGWLVSR